MVSRQTSFNIFCQFENFELLCQGTVCSFNTAVEKSVIFEQILKLMSAMDIFEEDGAV